MITCPHCHGTGQLPTAKDAIVPATVPRSHVARRMGISQQYLCDLLNGRRKWNASLFGRFNRAVARRVVPD